MNSSKEFDWDTLELCNCDGLWHTASTTDEQISQSLSDLVQKATQELVRETLWRVRDRLIDEGLHDKDTRSIIDAELSRLEGKDE